MAAPHLLFAVLFVLLGLQSAYRILSPQLNAPEWRWWANVAMVVLAAFNVWYQIRKGRAPDSDIEVRRDPRRLL